MRPVKKGISTKIYSHYSKARDDLFNKIGMYCSYCEMRLANMAEIEHVVPVANGGDGLNWDNFLLSCKYCNTTKSNDNTSRLGYYWPDKDNTFLAFEYDEINIISAASCLSTSQKKLQMIPLSYLNLIEIKNQSYRENLQILDG